MDATRAVTGTVQRPRSGGGPIGLPMGEPPGLVPGGPGEMDGSGHSQKRGGVLQRMV
jgi:hypothetical protein